MSLDAVIPKPEQPCAEGQQALRRVFWKGTVRNRLCPCVRLRRRGAPEGDPTEDEVQGVTPVRTMRRGAILGA